MNEYINILGVNVSATNLSLACESIGNWIETKKKTYVCIVPVSTIVDCQSDLKYKDIVNGAGMATPDGMPLVWIGKSSKNKTIQRTYGPDLMMNMCQRSQEKGYRHYFYGSTPERSQKLKNRLKEIYPALNIVGCFSPGFQDQNTIEEEVVLKEINQAKPDVLWVGLGSPKQDYWMYNHRDKLDVPVMVGVGAAFDFISGSKPQAPRWMQQNGLEWLFRLCCEPKRLWRRYLIGNTKFVFLLIKDLFRNKNI